MGCGAACLVAGVSATPSKRPRTRRASRRTCGAKLGPRQHRLQRAAEELVLECSSDSSLGASWITTCGGTDLNEVLTPILAHSTRGGAAARRDRSRAGGDPRRPRARRAGRGLHRRAPRQGRDRGRARRARAHDARFAEHVDLADSGADRHVRHRRRRRGTVNVSTMAAIVAAGAGRAGREARRPRRVVEVRLGRRARDARRRRSTSARRRGALRREVGIGFCFAPALPPGDALRGAGAQRARHADHLQLPRPARQPGGASSARPSACPTGRWPSG